MPLPQPSPQNAPHIPHPVLPAYLAAEQTRRDTIATTANVADPVVYRRGQQAVVADTSWQPLGPDGLAAMHEDALRELGLSTE